jgi:putative phage-type endonuclease
MNEKTEIDLGTFLLESLDCGDPYLRRNFIGASDAPIIMGVSPWRTPLQLYQEKLGVIGPQKESEAMAEGKRNEAEARLMFETIVGEKTPPRRLFSKKYPWMMASLDGISADGYIAVEIKNGKASHEDAKKGIISAYYVPQLVHQLYVIREHYPEVTSISYFSYRTINDFVSITHDWNEEEEKKLIAKEEEFIKCIEDMKEPELTDKDYIQSDNYSLLLLSSALAINRALEKEYKKLCQEIEEQIVKEVDGKNTKGFGLTIRKINRKGIIDYSRVEELYDVDLERYRKESSDYWKITIEE